MIKSTKPINRSNDIGGGTYIRVRRIEPLTHNGVDITGVVKEYSGPTTVDSIIDDIGNNFGGGVYKMIIIETITNGQSIGVHQFEIGGTPKASCRCDIRDLMARGCKCGGN